MFTSIINGKPPKHALSLHMSKESKWSSRNERVLIPNVPCIIPPDVKTPNLQAILMRARLEEIQYQLTNIDSESAQIIKYDKELSRTCLVSYNAQGFRNDNKSILAARDSLYKERRNLIEYIDSIYPVFRVPAALRIGYSKVTRKFYIPDPNIIGLILGPRGDSIKELEKEFDVQIQIRGIGSRYKPITIGEHDPSDNEPLHALIEGTTVKSIDDCVRRLEYIISPKPDNENQLKIKQLTNLALYTTGAAFPTDTGKKDDTFSKNDNPPWYDPTLEIIQSEELDNAMELFKKRVDGYEEDIIQNQSSKTQMNRLCVDFSKFDLSYVLPDRRPPGEAQH